MFTKTTIALAAALILGAASAAQAGKDDGTESGGGFKIGPLGQVMGSQPAPYRGGNAYGSATHAYGSATHAFGSATPIREHDVDSHISRADQ